MTNNNLLHVLNFGTFNEGRYFIGKYKDSFDIVSLNANLIAHAPEGTTGFVAGLKRKRFFIDPQFHAFMQHPKTVMRKKDKVSVLKESVRKLADYYDSIVQKKAGVSAITADELTGQVISEIATTIAQFQLSILSDTLCNLAESDFVDPAQLAPDFLISPYTYLEADNWQLHLKKNLHMLDAFRHAATSLDPKREVYAQLVLSQEVLTDNQSANAIADSYLLSGISGIVLWIDSFSETKASSHLLAAYVEFIRRLRQGESKVIILHGGYFSIALSGSIDARIDGVGHGIEYGEQRAVIPVGGGVPLAKYYFPRFHKRVDYYPDAQDILIEMKWIESQKSFYANVCSCNTCKSVIIDEVQSNFEEFGETKDSLVNGRPYPTAQAMRKSREHYLNCKIAEYERIKKDGLTKNIELLRETAELASKIKSHDFGHLTRWVEILQRLK
ncbi:MAG: hypothetical protein WBP29_08725 [Candidatus Zixiibacteriota bacterium]